MFGFLLRFIILYLLLMIPWPGVESAFRSKFVGAGNALYGVFGEYYGVRSLKEGEGSGDADVAILVPRRDIDRILNLNFSSREVGYLATVVTISLILATPATWCRRLQSLLCGLGLVCLFIAIRPLPLVLYTRYVDVQIMSGAVQLTAVDKAIAAAAKFVGIGQHISYIVPIIIWIVVAVRRDVVIRLLPELAGRNK